MKSKRLETRGRSGRKLQIATAEIVAFAVVLLIVPLLLTGCPTTGGTAGGIGGTGIHGELNAGTTVSPNDPTNVNIGVGGKIYFAKRPLTPAEKAEIFKTAHDAAIACWNAHPNDCDEKHELTKLTDRARYRYRLTWKTVRPIVEAGWTEGRKTIWSP